MVKPEEAVLGLGMANDDTPVPEYQLTARTLDMLCKSGERHKYDYGHAMIISGPPGQGGAARLAARGAIRIGAGLVSLVCTPESQAEHAARLDAVMVKTCFDNASLSDQLVALKPSAICIGPNLGLGAYSQFQLSDVLALDVPLCIDADAITLIACAPDNFGTVAHGQIVMTPHEGELRRLIPDAFARTHCRVTLAKTAARKLQCTVLFKGSDTIIAGPDGACVAVLSAGFKHASWLATAGSGDVLAGFITGLMARGFGAFDAAALGANLHLECAETFGPGIIAEDIPEMLPRVFARMCVSR